MIDRDIRRVVLVQTVLDAPPPRSDTAVVVLDTAWTPGADDRLDLLPIRQVLAPVFDGRDLFSDALRRLDGWADAADLPNRLSLGDLSVWFAMREELWHWLTERMIWRAAISALRERLGSVRLVLGVEDPALLDAMAPLDGEGIGGVMERPAPDGAAVKVPESRAPGAIPWTRRLDRFIGSPDRRIRRRRLARRIGLLDDRIRTIAAGPPDRVMVISYTGIHQRIQSSSSARSVDPNLGSVIERMRREGPAPIVIGLGLDHRSDVTWPQIAADPRLLPQSLLATRWHGNDVPDPVVIRALTSDLRRPEVPLDVDGVDLGPALMARVRAFADAWLTPTLTLASRVENLIAELRPGALLLTHEGIRAPWLVAAHRAGIPSFAIQHGVLYPTHPGYCHRRDATLILPSRTFVYGSYEREVLLEYGHYRPEEVEVSGSPRVDLDSIGAAVPAGDTERSLVRHELTVRDGDRMLVVSTTHARLVRTFYLMHMLEQTLGGPLEGVHIVFKQHPGESDEGPYRDLLDGLARSGGYEPPPMTVVRDIDLYRLLRASDAHLGFQSTVLTDAVVVGVPNLIAHVGALGNPLDYVGAGVATPVRDVEDVRVALEHPVRPDPAQRKEFLDRHFMSGDASVRIVSRIRDSLDGDRARSDASPVRASPPRAT